MDKWVIFMDKWVIFMDKWVILWTNGSFYGQMGHFIAILGAKQLNESSKKIVDYFMEIVPDEKLP